MPSFFTALNPMSSNSGITFRATKHAYSEEIRQQNLPDLTLDLVIPFLWKRKLSILDGIYETFTVFYGDHFDKYGRGFGQKGVLDFTLFPLLSRKLIADTYLLERKDNYLLNFLAWSIALPIKALSFGLALAFTIAIAPLVIAITLLRRLFPGSSPPPPPGDAGAATVAMGLSIQTAYAALHVALYRLDLAGIRNQNNIQRLIENPQNLALVYAMEHLTHVVDENDNPIANQHVFDFLFEHRNFWTDIRVVEHLNELPIINAPNIRFDQLQREVTRPIAEVVQNLNGGQSTHTKSVHTSTSKSAIRLQEAYSNSVVQLNPIPDSSIAKMVRNYDKKLVGQRTDHEIVKSLESAMTKFANSAYRDSASNVSSSALLHYCWAAAHDSKQWREGVTQETAEACFYAALYEVDREYALLESGVDSGRAGSHQACEGGSFNKLIEGMAKIHNDCEVNFITPASAALKLPCIVRQVLKRHLAENPAAFERLKSEGLSEIWSELQPNVLTIMQHDFLSIYPSINEQTNPDLLALVDAGQYTDLSQDLPLLEQELQQHAKIYQANRPAMVMMC